MKVLLIHNEAKYFGGAEKVLGYFLNGLSQSGVAVAVAAGKDSKTARLLPSTVRPVWIEGNDDFSVARLLRQTRELAKFQAQFPFDVIHGWAARDWELSALAGGVARRPAIGTLHDHPEASFISTARRRLMRWSAAAGLRRVVCVSEAVRAACASVGYSADKLAVVHNGLPEGSASARNSAAGICRLGFLGVFSERKGMRGLFAILAELSRLTSLSWQLKVAGGPQGESGERMLSELRQQHSQAAWWPQVEWCGWVGDPRTFLSTVDILLVPSHEFDPLPTVLLEAGQMGVPAVAARVGGVAEIVADGRTGWLFDSGDWAQAARILAGLVGDPVLVGVAGNEARRRVAGEFALPKMVAQYRELYSIICRHGH